MGAHEKALLWRKPLDLVIGQRQHANGQGLQLRHRLAPGLLQLIDISRSRLPASSHDLRLEAFRQHDAGIVPNHVARLLLDQQRRLQHVAFGRILRLDDGQLIGRIVAEHVLEELVEPGASVTSPSAVRPS